MHKETQKPLPVFTKGNYLRWTANRYLKSWDVYAFIEDEDEDNYYIKSLDDFKVATIAKKGEAVTSGEFKEVIKLDVMNYLKDRNQSLAMQKMVVKEKADEEIKGLTNLIEQGFEFFQQIS